MTFRFNIVRNVAAGINLLGYDIPSRPTRQTTDVTIAHNLFYGVTTALGGNGWFLLIGDEPRNVTVEHNTIDFDGTTAVYAYGGTATVPRTILGFRFANNALRHNKYGMNGASSSVREPDADEVFSRRVLPAQLAAGWERGALPVGECVQRHLSLGLR